MNTLEGFRGKKIFFAELDDDYQEIAGITDHELQRRLTCYYLLAPNTIVHPAYAWQSRLTNTLLEESGRELLRPPFTELELGAHDSIEDYMQQRIELLRRPRVSTRELNAYEAYGDDLFDQAGSLSIRFNLAARRPVSSSRRDESFRANLLTDLEQVSFDAESLGQLIEAFTVSPHRQILETKVGEDLKKFVLSHDELVTVDTFLGKLYNLGYTEIATNKLVKSRVLALYYRTYADADTLIPGIRKLQLGSIVNPYDPDVFWALLTSLFGERVAILGTDTSETVVRALRDIRESVEWVRFTELYFQTMQQFDHTVRSEPEMLAGFEDFGRDVVRSRRYAMRKLWDTKKIAVVSAVFAALGTPAVAFTTPVLAVASVATGVGAAVATREVILSIRAINETLASTDVGRVRELIRLKLRQI